MEQPILPDEITGLLARLVDRSLVILDESGRYRLYESVRHYAAERLAASQESGFLHARHTTYFAELAEQVAPRIHGPAQMEALAQLDMEFGNLRHALEWSADATDSIETGLKLAGRLGNYWHNRGFIAEGRAWLERLLEGSSTATDTARAPAQAAAGMMAWRQGDYPIALRWTQESLAAFQAVSDPVGIGRTTTQLANVLYYMGEFEQARPLYRELVEAARTGDDPARLGIALNNLGLVYLDEGDLDHAEACFAESLAIRRTVGDRQGAANPLCHLGEVAILRGEFEKSRPLLEESLALRTELGDRLGAAYSHQSLATLAVREMNWTDAETHLAASFDLRQEVGERWGMAVLLDVAAALESARGRQERAAVLLGAVHSLRRRMGAASTPAGVAETGRITDEVIAALGERAFHSDFRRGAEMTPEEASEFAVSGFAG